MRPSICVRSCFAIRDSVTAYSAGSEFSKTISRSAPKVMTRSQISAPIDPPPPVTTMDYPSRIFRGDCNRSSRSAAAGPRPQRGLAAKRRQLLPARASGCHQSQTAGIGQNSFCASPGLERRRRQNKPRDDNVAIAKRGYNVFEIFEAAHDRDAAHRHALVRIRR